MPEMLLKLTNFGKSEDLTNLPFLPDNLRKF